MMMRMHMRIMARIILCIDVMRQASDEIWRRGRQRALLC
jgi:hypothetical protein